MTSESVLYRICTHIYFFVALNLLFIALCLPLITVPMSLTALFSVSRQFIRDGSISVFRPFFHSMREYWKISLGLGWSALAVGVFLAFDIMLVLRMTPSLQWILLSVVGLAMFLYLLVVLSLLPTMATATDGWRRILWNAALLSTYKPWLTLLNGVVLVAFYLLVLRFPVLLILCGFSLSAFITTWVHYRKLKTLPAQSDGGTETRH